MDLQEALGVVQGEVRRRIAELQDLAAGFELLGQPSPARALAERSGVRQLVAVPVEDVPVPKVKTPRVVGGDGKRVSKFLRPLGEMLYESAMRPNDIEKRLGVPTGSWYPIAIGRPDLFVKEGEGRGNVLWRLTDAGRREFGPKPTAGEDPASSDRPSTSTQPSS